LWGGVLGLLGTDFLLRPGHSVFLCVGGFSLSLVDLVGTSYQSLEQTLLRSGAGREDRRKRWTDQV
jgi:hypothetical protein